ncbi:Crp/Fnr family transcriptional regulator [Chryseolinea lacunae]|uniref:Crp/Fnr family transcriptional regulator n=1 Tax=Chryseolinea lacunae TaxID=2801331 RepID=A0ABS1KQG0_9BACT|nr:Crp/Fnr family transcriptional regulator [Chryseolinea lacunae]MBL0740932.1 Crp/Fnr family transcriptional regulator [Chryseolinea lacunae]
MREMFRAHIEKIVSLTDDEFDIVMEHFVHKKLKRHQYAVQQGEFVDHEYFVVKGLLKSFFANADGKEHIIQFALEDWWISDYQAFVNQARATFNIDCLEESDLLSLSFGNKKKLCDKVHKMEHFFRVKTMSGYIALQQRVLSLMNDNAQTRHAHLLEHYPALFQRVPKALIASYLGVSRETLSRFGNS